MDKVGKGISLREDTHKKKFFFSGRTSKGVGRVKPLTTKQKNIFFLFFKSSCFSPKIGKRDGPPSHWCREGKTLVVRPLKKNTVLCVSSLTPYRN